LKINQHINNSKGAKSTAIREWNWVKLGDVCAFVGGGTPSKQESSYWNGKLNWASVKDVKGNFLNSTEDTITELGLKNSASSVAEPNDLILITRISPGKSIISNIRTAVNQDLKIVKPKFKTSSKFLHYYFQAIEREVIKRSSGTTVLGITLNNLNEIQIPLLDSDTQHAIVSKIEELLSELDKGKQQLETAQQQLKIYRQAVLKWAFEGRLTNENVKEGELPEGWEMTSIINLVEKNKHSLKAGPFGSSLKKEFYVSKGYKIYGQEQVIGDDPFIGDYFIGEKKYEELKSCQVKPFDILISLVGTVGKVLILPENSMAGVINPRLIKITLDRNIYIPKFFKYYFESSVVKIFYSGAAKGTTMDVLNLGIIKTIPFPLPPLEEQNHIVQEIESRISVCEKVEETITTSLAQAETLRQSILKKAFEGKLV
jgi:type I restriction enzyme S subunit